MENGVSNLSIHCDFQEETEKLGLYSKLKPFTNPATALWFQQCQFSKQDNTCNSGGLLVSILAQDKTNVACSIVTQVARITRIQSVPSL